MNDSPKRILVIDDEPDMLDFLSSVLKDNDFDVITAVNGRDGFEKAKSQKPDLITLDISMPEESGVKAFRNFQESDETKDIPVIIVTGISNDFKKFISTRKVVNPPAGYLEKPIDASEFLDKVNELVA